MLRVLVRDATSTRDERYQERMGYELQLNSNVKITPFDSKEARDTGGEEDLKDEVVVVVATCDVSHEESVAGCVDERIMKDVGEIGKAA